MNKISFFKNSKLKKAGSMVASTFLTASIAIGTMVATPNKAQAAVDPSIIVDVIDLIIIGSRGDGIANCVKKLPRNRRIKINYTCNSDWHTGPQSGWKNYTLKVVHISKKVYNDGRGNYRLIYLREKSGTSPVSKRKDKKVRVYIGSKGGVCSNKPPRGSFAAQLKRGQSWTNKKYNQRTHYFYIRKMSKNGCWGKNSKRVTIRKGKKYGCYGKGVVRCVISRRKS